MEGRNIGAYIPVYTSSSFAIAIGSTPGQGVPVVEISGTSTTTLSGDLGSLLRDQYVSGDAACSGDANSLLGTNSPILGSCIVESGANGGITIEKDLSMTGGASSAGSASGSLWVSKEYVLNDSDYRIQLTYDPDKQGILITRTDVTNLTNNNIWYDLRTQGFYPEEYQDDCRAYDALYYPHSYRQYKGMLVAGADGYLRVFDDKATNDTGKNTDEEISSYMYTAPFAMNEIEMEGKLKSLQVYLGGKSLGSNSVQSDSISYEAYVGDSIEEVYAKIINDDTPAGSGTVTGSGRSIRKTVYGRGAYAVLKLYNSNISETWALNKLSGVIVPAGRIR